MPVHSSAVAVAACTDRRNHLTTRADRHGARVGLSPTPVQHFSLVVMTSSGRPLVSPLQAPRMGRDTQRYDGARRLLACAVILRHRSAESDREVLLISSSKHVDAWVLPKGGWESDETVEQCALREAEEEAGVAGGIVRALGAPLDFATAKGSLCRLFGFELACLQQYDQWAESDRRREWMSLADARERLAYRPELVEMLARIRDGDVEPR